jgi:hypothetical protein
LSNAANQDFPDRSVERDIDRNVIRGRTPDFARRFLPDGLTLLDRLDFLASQQALLLNQLQGRSYAGMLGLVERFISASVLRQTRDHALGNQDALETLVRFAAEKLRHQELFRRLEQMTCAGMPPGYALVTDANAFASAVLLRSSWSVLALTCHIELLARAHYEQAIEPREELCPLYKDIFRFHWRDERQHVLIDELEWATEHARLSEAERDQAVDDLIALLQAVDGVLRAQSKADSRYFLQTAGRSLTRIEAARIESTLLAAYRWQFIVSGVQHVHFRRLLTSMTTVAQSMRIMTALRPITQA